MYKGPRTNMYLVRSLSMTNWLCNHGHKILKVEDSERDEKLKVFFCFFNHQTFSNSKHFSTEILYL